VIKKDFVLSYKAQVIIACGVSAIITLFAMMASVMAAAGTANGGGEAILGDPAAIKVGEATFYQNCVYCHGSKGSGGSARALQCRDMKPDYIFETITNGRINGANVMPPWKDTFDEKARWQLVAYIRSLRTLPECDSNN